MKRRRNDNQGIGTLTVPLSMIDLSWLVLMFALIKAQFLVESVSLPNLVRTAEAGTEKEVQTATAQIALKTNGDVTYDGKPVRLEDVPDRISAETDSTRPVLLSIETDEQGRGASQTLLQLMHDLSTSGVGQRVKVQYAELPKPQHKW